MTRRLIFATQTVDPDDPILGATVGMIEALAARLDEVVVLADRAVEGALPANCRVHVFGAESQAERGRRFVTHLNRELSPKNPLKKLIHVGELSTRKRVDLLLRAITKLAATRQDFVQYEVADERGR